MRHYYVYVEKPWPVFPGENKMMLDGKIVAENDKIAAEKGLKIWGKPVQLTYYKTV